MFSLQAPEHTEQVRRRPDRQHTSDAGPGFRPGVDGIRAVAVGAVVA